MQKYELKAKIVADLWQLLFGTIADQYNRFEVNMALAATYIAIADVKFKTRAQVAEALDYEHIDNVADYFFGYVNNKGVRTEHDLAYVCEMFMDFSAISTTPTIITQLEAIAA